MSKQMTLCWDCGNACNGGCSWSRCLEPVKGWEAKKTADSYVVKHCPNFKRETYGFGQYRTADEYIGHLEGENNRLKRKLIESNKRRTMDTYLLTAHYSD